MQEHILITFKSTTDTFKADQILDQHNKIINFDKKKITSIPYSLSKSCYGLGIEVFCNKDTIKDISKIIKKVVDYKFIWVQSKTEEFVIYQGDVS